MVKGEGGLYHLKIVNVIATIALGQNVDLLQLANFRDLGFIYDTEIYGGRCAYLKDRTMHGKVSIFASGRMISIGTKSYKAAKTDLRYTTAFLAKLNLIKPTNPTPELRNIVATANLPKGLNLEYAAERLPHTLYEPEQFPCVMYFADELNGASMLLFSTGKVVIAGLRQEVALGTLHGVLDGLVNSLSATS